jgi:hypothetical protein
MYRKNFSAQVKLLLDIKLQHDAINYTSLRFETHGNQHYFNYGFSSKKYYGGFAKINLTREEWDYIVEGSSSVKIAS